MLSSRNLLNGKLKTMNSKNEQHDHPSESSESARPFHVAGDRIARDKLVQQTAYRDIIGRDSINYQLPQPGILAPYQLPAPPADFSGRETELAILREVAMRNSVAAIGLVGQGGIGKTALALVLAHELATYYAEAQIYLDLRGTGQPLTSRDIMTHTIRAFNPVEQLPVNDAELAAVYRTVLHGHRVLLFYDNVDSPELLIPVLPPEGCLLLLTSRRRFILPGMHQLNLEVLPRSTSIELLLRICPRIGSQADTIALLCGDLPLALRIAASTIAERKDVGPEQYVGWLRNDRGRLKQFSEVEASFGLSYALLKLAVQQLWRVLAVIVNDFSAVSAVRISGLAAELANESLGDLVRYSLVQFDPNTKRYRLHDLARLVAGARLVGDERKAAERRHAIHYSSLPAFTEEAYRKGGKDLIVGLALYDREIGNIMAAQDWAAANCEVDDTAAALCHKYAFPTGHVMVLRQHPERRILILEAAMAAVRVRGDSDLAGLYADSMGVAYAELRKPHDAIRYFEQALQFARTAESEDLEAKALGNMGNAYLQLEEYRKAIDLFNQALSTLRKTSDRHAIGATLSNLGIAHAELGDNRQALLHFSDALVERQAVGDILGMARDLENAATLFDRMDEREEAISFAQKAVELYESIHAADADKLKAHLDTWRTEIAKRNA